jgi:deoxyribodipyrimidine photo-lyase
MQKQKINVVWFKRDLRLSDHQPLATAIQDGLPVLLLYCFEPSLMFDPHSDMRHWRFAHESLEEMNTALAPYEARIYIFHREVFPLFNQLVDFFDINAIYSHLDVGLKISRDRNERIRQLAKGIGIKWMEYSQDAIVRGAQNREDWEEHWYDYMQSPLQEPDVSEMDCLMLSDSLKRGFDGLGLPKGISTSNIEFQPGGEYYGRMELETFLNERGRHYIHSLSSPSRSEWGGSRLSPYLAHGCLSMREVYQAAVKNADRSFLGNNYRQYLIRLFWRSHYMQKLDTEWELEFEPMNRALADIERPYDDELFEAWVNAETGYPIIDASMRCLKETGFVNFRMRATIVTFVTYTLWQDWRRMSVHLASLFLDFEPGLHYGQIHMQAGLTGYHTLRVFNPSTQFEKHDKSAEFVKKWLPELRSIPLPTIYEPWLMNEKQQHWYNCKIGEDYPRVIVDYEIATRIAKRHYWKLRQRPKVFDNLPSIWGRHCLPKNIEEYKRNMLINKGELRFK